MSAKTVLVDEICALPFMARLTLLDKVLTSKGYDVKFTEQDDGFKIAGLDDSLGVFDFVIDEHSINDVIRPILDKVTKGMNCPATSMLLLRALLELDNTDTDNDNE